MPAGRPKKEVNLETLKSLASLQCTIPEICSIIKISEALFYERLKDDEEFLEAYEGGKANGRLSLRRLQYGTAKGGNCQMQIHLGKHWLDQREKSDLNIGGKDDGPGLTVILEGKGKKDE